MEPFLILHPTTYSSASYAALQMALNIARRQGARLLVAHVVPPFTWAGKTTFGNNLPQPETYLKDLEVELRCRTLLTDDTVPVEFLVGEGDEADWIVRIAMLRHCSLIVMGNDGVGKGLRGRLFRSVVEKVVEQAPCPLLLVKPGSVAGPFAA